VTTTSDDRVGLTVRVTKAEAAALHAWVERRNAAVDAHSTACGNVTISDVLRRCIQAVVRDEPPVTDPATRLDVP
jgi:hypothetical protein